MKYRTFVTDEFTAIPIEDQVILMNILKAKINEFFPDNGGSWTKAVNNATHKKLPDLCLNWTFDKPRSARRKVNGDTISSIKELQFLVTKEIGHLEDKPEVTNLQNFNIFASTDGHYHEYRQHHSNDTRYEGPGHFWYNTDLTDIQLLKDMDNWFRIVGYTKSISIQ